MKEIELNNKVRSALLRVQAHFRIKKVPVNENFENICQAVVDLLKIEGVASKITLDKDEKYMVECLKPHIVWRPDNKE